MKTHTIIILLVFLYGAFDEPFQNTNGIIRHDTNIDSYRKLGNETQFDCVGRYSISEEDSAFAAGILVSPNWVLTAAHFVEDSSVWKFGNEFYQSEIVIRHPEVASIADGRPIQYDGVDMAMIKLKKKVIGVEPAFLYKGESELKMKVTKVGYGYVGDGILGMKTPRTQEKLGGHNIIDQIGGVIKGIELSDKVLVCDFDNPASDTLNYLGSAIPLQLEIGGSKGDSGGGVFAFVEGKWQLVGIVSGALNREIKYGSLMAFARTSSAVQWIEEVRFAN